MSEIDDMAEFMEERLNEDEAAAEAASSGHPNPESRGGTWQVVGDRHIRYGLPEGMDAVSETDEIAAWLRAQAEADIEAAGKATPGPWKDDGSPACMVFQPAAPRGIAWCSNARPDEDLANSAHIARHDPLTETARAESVLAVLKLYDLAVTVAEAKAGPAKSAEIMRLVIRDLAAGYRHREGYQESWA